MWAIFLDGYTYHAQAPNMRFYGDKEKRDGIRDSKTHRIFSWTMTWEDIQLFENDKEDSLGLNSITRLIEFLKNPQMGYIRETAFGCIADAENFMGHGGALYQGEITIDESCYDELTDFSTDEKLLKKLIRVYHITGICNRFIRILIKMNGSDFGDDIIYCNSSPILQRLNLL